MKCKHFITLKTIPLSFIPEGICDIDDSECINPYIECVILTEKKNRHLFEYTTNQNS